MSKTFGRVVLSIWLALWLCGYQASAVTRQYDQVPVILPPFEQPSRTGQELHGRKRLQLRHIYHHGTRRHPRLHRTVDIPRDRPLWALDEDTGEKEAVPALWVRPQSMSIQRLADRSPAHINALQHAHGAAFNLPLSAWTIDTITGPNYTDRDTVLTFARMCFDAYNEEPNTGDWKDVGGHYNYTDDFGWRKDGLRGHIFADETNKTVVIALKGTSPAVLDGEETTSNDKINDNLFFGCCCGQGGSLTLKVVCDCMTSTYTCNSTCLSTSVKEKDLYYDAAKELYNNVTARYPGADVWLTGHSLGGAMASLLGMTYGHAVITVGAPGDVMPAERLGLPIPKVSYPDKDGHRTITGAIHFGHTADPIFMGSCSGGWTTCAIAGYAMQSVCHTGLECTYDTVADKGWHNTMLNHRIKVTLAAMESYEGLPECNPTVDCVDCFNWKYYESNNSSPTTSKTSTSTSSSYIRTRTETCKTPGWWGCLDETTTSTNSATTTTSKTSTSSTMTCETPGWFGCLDETTTTTSSSSTRTSVTATTTCETPGWFGCLDPTKVTTASRTSTSSTSTCHEPGWFGCRDPASTTTTSTKKHTTSSAAPTPESTCDLLGIFFCHPFSTSTSTSTTTPTVSTTIPITITPAPTRKRPTVTKTVTSTTTQTQICEHPGIFWGCWDRDKDKGKHRHGRDRDPDPEPPEEDPWVMTTRGDRSL